MRKKLAQFLGKKLSYFKGKNKLIRLLYSPDRNLHSGEKFITDYFGKKYEGITSNFIDWGVYFKGGLEKSLVNYIKTEIKHFQYFFDIGSNTGSISLPFVHEKNLQIISFEPLEYNYKKLIINYKLNNAFENHKFHKIALSNRSGKDYIHFSNTQANAGTASLNSEWNINNQDKEEVSLERLDNLYNFKNKNIFIKIDTEGHEDKVIDGSVEILRNNKVLMYLETENENLLNRLKKMNFEILFPFFREGKFKFSKKQHGLDTILRNY